MIRRIKNIASDNLLQIIECGILVIAILIPFVINVSELVARFGIDNWMLQWAAETGNVVAACLLCVVALWRIRDYNKDSVLMNSKNVYHDYPYCWYYFCSKFLGINKCGLALVPIYMQFKLVINGVFSEFPLDENDYPELESENDIVVTRKGSVNTSLQINLLLEDTYPIEEQQIPRGLRGLPTLKISRNEKDETSRHFSQKFVDEIITEVHKLKNGVTVNVFATTNPMNTLNIAKRAFKNADRGNVTCLFVFQQKRSGKRFFEKKGKKIY